MEKCILAGDDDVNIGKIPKRLVGDGGYGATTGENNCQVFSVREAEASDLTGLGRICPQLCG